MTQTTDREFNSDAIHIIREACLAGLGFNCTFVDDDMRVLIGLAQRAVLAGLAADCTPDMQRRFQEAAEKFRENHENALGFKINKQAKPSTNFATSAGVNP